MTGKGIAYRVGAGFGWSADGTLPSNIGAIPLPACCRCDEPITGTPVTDPGDPRLWCSDGCRTATAEERSEGYYGYGVAT